MSDLSEMSDTEKILKRLYQVAVEIGDQRLEAMDAAEPSHRVMLRAVWNECELEIRKVLDSQPGDSHQDAEAFLELVHSASE